MPEAQTFCVEWSLLLWGLWYDEMKFHAISFSSKDLMELI